MIKRWSMWAVVLVILVAMGAIAQSQAETTTLVLVDGQDNYNGTKDTTIFSEGNLGNGSGSFLFAGQTARGRERRALIAFDLEAIPDNATITAVTLELTVSRTLAGNTQVRAHRLSKDWGEGSENAGGQEGRGISASNDSATWRSNFHNTSEWDTQGGDFEAGASASATALGVNSKVRLSGEGMVADVQAWVSGEADNFGWLLRGDGTAKRFVASEGGNENQRPKLTIEYTTPE